MALYTADQLWEPGYTDAKHSIEVQNMKALNLVDSKIIGDGEYGIGSASGNVAAPSSVSYCTFENAAMQIYGGYGSGLVIDHCTFNDSCVNVQAGSGVTVQNSEFNATLTECKYQIRPSPSGLGR